MIRLLSLLLAVVYVAVILSAPADVGDKINDAGDSLHKAAKEAGDAVSKAAEDAKDGLSKAADDTKNALTKEGEGSICSTTLCEHKNGFFQYGKCCGTIGTDCCTELRGWVIPAGVVAVVVVIGTIVGVAICARRGR